MDPPHWSSQSMSMLGAGGPVSQSQVKVGISNDVNSNDSSPLDINDVPQSTSHPTSAGGPQGQLGSLRKQGAGVSPIVQPNQEFNIHNEHFPALPAFRGENWEGGAYTQSKKLVIIESSTRKK